MGSKWMLSLVLVLFSANLFADDTSLKTKESLHFICEELNKATCYQRSTELMRDLLKCDVAMTATEDLCIEHEAESMNLSGISGNFPLEIPSRTECIIASPNCSDLDELNSCSNGHRKVDRQKSAEEAEGPIWVSAHFLY